MDGGGLVDTFRAITGLIAITSPLCIRLERGEERGSEKGHYEFAFHDTSPFLNGPPWSVWVVAGRRVGPSGLPTGLCRRFHLHRGKCSHHAVIRFTV